MNFIRDALKKASLFFLKIDFRKIIKSYIPQIVTKLAKSIALKYGFGITGIQGFFLSILIRIGIKKANKVADNISDSIEEKRDEIEDNLNDEKYKEVISDEKSTLEDKIRAETDLLNRHYN